MVQARLETLRPAQRAIRRPKHPFYVIARPFQIQPFFIAPVMPGETLTNMMIQARVVTDPIKNPLIGWWQEYYFFYVKFSDLDGRADFTEMFVNPNANLNSYDEAASAGYYHADRVNWTKLCLKRVTEEYFRAEGEAWNIVTHGGFSLPGAGLVDEQWMHSMQQQADIDAVDPTLTVGGDGLVTGSEVEYLLLSWQIARQQGLTQMSYEDYLQQYGVKTEAPEVTHKPELIRYLREWQYPTNTIDPSNGTPRSAVSWVIGDRADKKRYFKEPGFLFGVTLTRPKTYLQNQAGSLTSFMERAVNWLPAMFMDDAGISWQEHASGAGPVPSAAQAYAYDLRDLFIRGEQFTNVTLTTAENAVPLPSTALAHKYPSSTDAQALFVYSEGGETRWYARQDGVVQVSIQSHIRDLSPVAPQQ